LIYHRKDMQNMKLDGFVAMDIIQYLSDRHKCGVFENKLRYISIVNTTAGGHCQKLQ